jgi:hypothetical protein
MQSCCELCDAKASPARKIIFYFFNFTIDQLRLDGLAVWINKVTNSSDELLNIQQFDISKGND